AQLDPVPAYRARLLEGGVADEAELAGIQAEIEAAIDPAVAYAKSSPWPDPSELDRYVYAEGTSQ
ncbi:MAG: thiamine pyrophosphate-dependent dehydrogenase E1 component subunit alpha, partial [Actinobacteria bacterium]|nr:thiamine pyrophosphate-dependent dehydrogenase E1 component subunit alpha [Actinomycetota bacterium]